MYIKHGNIIPHIGVLWLYRHLKVACHLETIRHQCQYLAVAQVLGVTQERSLCQILWVSSPLRLLLKRRVTSPLPAVTRQLIGLVFLTQRLLLQLLWVIHVISHICRVQMHCVHPSWDHVHGTIMHPDR